MSEYLVFRLYGPMASWGEIAVGESRHSATYPSRSALLGLLGAALGVERDDEDGQQALFSGYRLAVKMILPGSPMRDYHTVQAPPGKARFRTRRHELNADAGKLGTLLSMREYRCDALAVIVAEALPQARWSLSEVREALLHPRFTLYLGRKSCPLALPLDPQLIAAENVWQAADSSRQYSLAALLGSKYKPEKLQQPWPSSHDEFLLRPAETRLYWEEQMSSGQNPQMQLVRNDQPLHRGRWQFAPRREWMAVVRNKEAQ